MLDWEDSRKGTKGTLFLLKDLNITQAAPKLLGFDSPFASGSVPGTADMCHAGQLIFLYICVPANMYVHPTYAGALRGQKNVGSPEIGVTDRCEAPCGCGN